MLIGSTEKMGVGTNVQDRAVALHHLDAPWRPADVDQREGRIIRQGNLNAEVQVIRYLTSRSFDAYLCLLNRATCCGAPPWSAAGGWQCRFHSGFALLTGLAWLRCGEMVSGSGAGLGSESRAAGGRDVGSLGVPLAGSVMACGGGVAYRLVFPGDERAAAAANAYLADLGGTFARPLTLRSYGYDILRWFRFLAAAGVVFDEAVRGDYSDFMRWLRAAGKTGGARRPRSGPTGRGLNRETGKAGPDDRGNSARRHWRTRGSCSMSSYEFLLDQVSVRWSTRSRTRSAVTGASCAGTRTAIRWRAPAARGGSRKRYDPPDPKGVPRHLPDGHFDRVWAQLTCDRDRALVKIAADCGARPAELLGMNGEDVDWGDALVRVLRKGGGHVQWLPVSRDGIVWLRRYQASSGYVAGPGDPVWVAAWKRRRMSYEAYRAVFTRVNRRLAPTGLRTIFAIRRASGCWIPAWSCIRCST